MRPHGSKSDMILPVMAIALIGVVAWRMAKAQKAKETGTLTAGGPVPSPYAAAAPGIFAPLPTPMAGLARYSYPAEYRGASSDMGGMGRFAYPEMYYGR